MFTPAFISTPASSDPTKVLILGACELGHNLARAFSGLGVEVELLGEATLPQEHEHLLEIVREIRPDIVVPASDRVSVAALQRIEAEYPGSVAPSSRAIEAAYNREVMRSIACEELGLPTSKFAFADTLEAFAQATEDLGFPCVAKPVENTGGGTTFVLRDQRDVGAAWKHLKGQRAIIERFVEFDAAVLMLAIRSINPADGKLATWFCEPIAQQHEHGELLGSVQPLHLPERALDNARSVTARISNAIGGRGLFAVELFLVGEDIYFSGVSPRPMPSGTVTRVSQRFSQSELHARAILGLPIDATLISPGACAFSSHVPADIPREQFAQALSTPESDIHFSTDGGTVAMATADDIHQAWERAIKVREILLNH
ncbi:ATP-grasp domain-containing protein [Corynebacterium pseudopelargi]|uniref:Phosphoribosylglycinamide formyltransferase 2 n=1 Tax=Corynebacterium pseudopelargi TaxID=2080757 RepID=A0A3G6IS26_9CORY|nr:ATP-grasp domain-containing protein [Corynebacterium pseudopelargi]AZA08415.1 Phosphoribosylglycinamide formyltransferase 2 [Corynebacterium pseudopelargi]